MNIIVLNGGPGCVPGNTEFLTPTGWKRIDCYEDGDLVATSDREGNVAFECCEFVKREERMFRRVGNNHFGMTLTNDHKVLYTTESGYNKTCPFSEIVEKVSLQGRVHIGIPATFNFENSYKLQPLDYLQVAILADSYKTKEGYTAFNLKKERKQARLETLLKKAGIKYRVREFPSMPGWKRFIIPSKDFSKTIPSYWWTLSSEESFKLKEEMLQWDGSVEADGDKRFFSTKKEEADLFQLLCAKSGIKVTIQVDKRDDDTHKAVCYRVREYKIRNSAQKNTNTSWKSLNSGRGNVRVQDVLSEDGFSYCFTTKAGFWVARQEDRIFLTGNCGKDTIASHIVDHVKGTHKSEVKALLFDLAIGMSGLSREAWFALYNDRRFKESPCPYLVVAGKQVSLREYLIHISEHVMKPLFGNDFFGKQATKRLTSTYEGNETIVFSDGGFIEEVKELSELAYATNGHFFLVRVHRGEDDWKNDSRGWLHLSENNIRGVSFDVTNEEGKMEECAKEIIAKVSRVIAEKEED